MSDSDGGESGSRSQSSDESNAQYEEGSIYADVLTGMSNSFVAFHQSKKSTQSHLSTNPGYLAPATSFYSKSQQHIDNPSAVR